jgi:hypothetical protein
LEIQTIRNLEMKITISILAITISISCLAQTQSGDTENGKGIYLYSNGANYNGDWKNGRRHGKGIMIYPKGANEANTIKLKSDTTCICSNWSPNGNSDVNEEKIWGNIKTQIDNLNISQFEFFEHYKGAKGENLVKTKFSLGNFINCITIIDLVISEHYQQAAEKTSDWALGYAFPAVAAYKGLIEASIFTTKLIVENWVQDLYLMPIYQKVDELVAKEIRKGDANFNAYIFSGYVHGNPKLRKQMQAIEKIMFYRWEEIYGNDMFISMSSKNRGENSFSRILVEIRKKYKSSVKVITNELIFNEFIWIAANDHKKEMLGIFKDEMEIKAEEQALKFKSSIIKSICTSELSKKSNKKK